MDRLKGIRAKLDRAEAHIDDLHVLIEEFYRTRPHKVAAKRDPETRCPVYFVESVDAVPGGIPTVAGDALQNLRSVLDHIAYQLMCIKNQSEGPFRVYYPIFDSIEEYQRDNPGKKKPFRKDHLEAIHRTRPYKGGNDLFWQLERLNIIDKHRLLITAHGSFESFDVVPSLTGHMPTFPPEALQLFSPMKLFIRPADKLFPLKPGDELFRDGPTAEIHENMGFRLPVSVGEPYVLEPQPLEPFMRRMFNFIQETVELFTPILEERPPLSLAGWGY